MSTSGLENILKEIKVRTEAEVAGVRESARAETNEMRKQFENKKEEFIALKNQEYEREGEMLKKNLVTETRLELKKKLVNAKRGIIEEVFDSAVKQLMELKGGDYEVFIKTLLRETVVTGKEVVTPGREEKIFNKSFISRANKKYGWNIVLGKEAGSMNRGFIVSEEECQTIVGRPEIRDFIKQLYENKVIEMLFSVSADESRK
jgi:V/A-type H+-transporting ATPase subunit E